MVNDLNGLNITLPLGELPVLMSELSNDMYLIRGIVQQCFTHEEIQTNENLERLTILNTELVLLSSSKWVKRLNEKEVDELKQRLTEEEQQIRALLELKNNNRKSSIFTKFDQRLNLLKQLE